jgi:hypothetical protein
MWLEAMFKQAHGKPNHTRMKNKPDKKSPDLTTEYEAEGKTSKSKKKKGPGKGNVPNPY